MNNRDDDVELLEFRPTERFYRLDEKKGYSHSRCLTALVIITSLILAIQIAEIGYGAYVYEDRIAGQVQKMEKLVDKTNRVLSDWEKVYNKVNPYLDQIGVIANMSRSVSDLLTISTEMRMMWPQLYPALRNFNNFTHQTTQFMGWAEQCIKGYGFCGR